MLISRRGYNWTNVLSPKLVARKIEGLISGRVYNWEFMVYRLFLKLYANHQVFSQRWKSGRPEGMHVLNTHKVIR